MKSSYLKSLAFAFVLLIVLCIVRLVPEEKFLPHTDPLKLDQTEDVVEKINKVRVLCWVLTSPNTRIERGIYIEQTWGKRCDKLLFMSSRTQNESENTIALPVDEGRENLWRKARAAFKYVYEHHFDDADWFMKIDDDTYMVMENLRYMLYPYSPMYPLYFGFRYKPFTDQGYMAGASVVLSKEALRRFMNDPQPDSPCNADIEGADDVQIGICMDRLGVIAGDSRDTKKSERFLPVEPEFFIIEKGFNIVAWIRDFMYYKDKEHIETPSDIAVAFHYILKEKMYLYEYILYHLRPIVSVKPITLPQKLSFDEVISQIHEAENDFNVEGRDWRELLELGRKGELQWRLE